MNPSKAKSDMIVFIRNQRNLNFLSGDIQLSEDDAKNSSPG